MARQPVSFDATLQMSPAGTQLLSLRHPLFLLAVDAQSAGLSSCTQHLSPSAQYFSAGASLLIGSAGSSPNESAAWSTNAEQIFIKEFQALRCFLATMEAAAEPMPSTMVDCWGGYDRIRHTDTAAS